MSCRKTAATYHVHLIVANCIEQTLEKQLEKHLRARRMGFHKPLQHLQRVDTLVRGSVQQQQQQPAEAAIPRFG
jgi:hypothetical protein